MSVSEKSGNKVRKRRVAIAEQDPRHRVKNFDEVPLGYTPEQAQAEARRCLQCKKPSCISGCPVGVDIPSFIELIAEGDFAGAARKIKETNVLPAICGRVCPQEEQCEADCVLGKHGESIAIGRLERFAADYEREHNLVQIPPKVPSNGKKVAVIGSGPAGLTVAGDLIALGYQVTVFEAFHKPGGVLVYGIPEFRLPKAIVGSEVDYLSMLGVKFEMNFVVGKMISIEELLGDEGFGAVFIGVGAGFPRFMGIPGENLGGVCSANEYLTRSNLMKAYLFPKYDTPIVHGRRACVIGGGNVAMDAARTARRLGSEEVTILYRRSREELPARLEEIRHAEEEGIVFRFLSAPIEYLGDRHGILRKVRCQQMRLGEPDASGRRRPEPVEGAEFLMDTDLVIVAIGSGANPLFTKETKNLQLNKRGYIVADGRGQTRWPRVWAGGDIVTGSATVILAMGAGKKAAEEIHRMLSGNKDFG